MILIEALIDFFSFLRRGDTELRESSLVGESEMDRQSRKTMAWICGGAIAVLTGMSLAGWILCKQWFD